jgi:glycine/D-amino acid oxidase-like deaminating enzyme
MGHYTVKGDYRKRSYWLESQGKLTPNPPLKGEGEADIVIIGGGYTGLSTGYHLKMYDKGVDVALLEAEICGYGASGRNGGFNMTLFGLTPSFTKQRFGAERGREARKFMEESVDYLSDFISKHEIDCDYERSGYLMVATNKAQMKRLKEEFKAAEEMDFEGVEVWDKRRLGEEFKTDKYLLGWFEERCGILDPAKWARGLRGKAEEAGVDIYEYSPALKIERGGYDGYRYIVRTPEGILRAKKLVFATNAYSILFPELYKYQTPAFTRIVLTEPLTDEQMESIGWRNRAGIEDSRDFIHYYRLTADNRILLGGGDVGVTYGKNMEKDLDRRNFEELKRYLFWVFPQLEGIKFTHEWGGPVSITLDMAPATGYLGDDKSAVFALGCIGHGVSLTFNIGRTLAELLLDMDTPRTNLFFIGRKIVPWPPEPFRYLLSLAIRGYMRMEDKLLFGEK